MFGLEEITVLLEMKNTRSFPNSNMSLTELLLASLQRLHRISRRHRVGSFEHCILRVPRKIFTSFRCEVCSCAAVHLMLPGDPHPETTRISNMPRIRKSIAATASKKQQTTFTSASLENHPKLLKIYGIITSSWCRFQNSLQK